MTRSFPPPTLPPRLIGAVLWTCLLAHAPSSVTAASAPHFLSGPRHVDPAAEAGSEATGGANGGDPGRFFPPLADGLELTDAQRTAVRKTLPRLAREIPTLRARQEAEKVALRRDFDRARAQGNAAALREVLQRRRDLADRRPVLELLRRELGEMLTAEQMSAVEDATKQHTRRARRARRRSLASGDGPAATRLDL